MKKSKFIPFTPYAKFTPQEMKTRLEEFKELMQKRRTVRQFSDKPVPIEIIKNCVTVAGNAPSGANKQPWHFVVISDPEVKREIRTEAEKIEQDFYANKAPDEWLKALEPLATNDQKPFLDTSPYLVVIFEKIFDVSEEGEKIKHYYVRESVGIATGMLITALHFAGLSTLTYTPSPMGFLNKILNRPKNEKPFMVLVVGFPAEDTMVPNLEKKKIEEITMEFD